MAAEDAAKKASEHGMRTLEVEVAGPGFVNLRYSDAFLSGLPARILREGAAFGAGFGRTRRGGAISRSGRLTRSRSAWLLAC